MTGKTKLTFACTVLGIVLLTVLFILASDIGRERIHPSDDRSQNRAAGRKSGVACRGRIEPEDGLIRLSVPSSSSLGPALVAELKVKEGDDVVQGQVIAFLDSRQRLEAAWHVAQSRIKVAEARLAHVRAGAKAGDLAAQEAEIGRLRREVGFAENEWRRYEKLRAGGSVAISLADRKRIDMETWAQLLRQAEEKLKSLAEIRETDIRLAECELQEALSDRERAKAELDQASIRSPLTGKVIKVYAHPGERVGDQGVVELAETGQMYAVAEVYETDITRVKPGQRARVIGDALPGPLEGEVHKIGLKVSKSSTLGLDPSAFSDERVFEVKIRLFEGHRVAGLTNAQVTVEIQP
jgi:HlyD family secretion protein